MDSLVKVLNPLTPERTLQELNEAHRRCEDLNQIADGYVKALQDGRAGLANGKPFFFFFLQTITLIVLSIRNTTTPA